MKILQEVQKLSKKISGKIHYEFNVRHLNWFNVGGSAKIFFKPNTLDELIIFLKKFSNVLPIKVLGVGSNTLIRDGGYDGVIIKLGKNFSHLSLLDECTIVAGAAALDKNVSNFALENSIRNFEFLSCIPGAIGGAIRMNCGCYGEEFSNLVISIQAMDLDGNLKVIPIPQIKYFYRGSDLSNELIFLSATLRGLKADEENISKKIFGLQYNLKKKFDNLKKIFIELVERDHRYNEINSIYNKWNEYNNQLKDIDKKIYYNYLTLNEKIINEMDNIYFNIINMFNDYEDNYILFNEYLT